MSPNSPKSELNITFPSSMVNLRSERRGTSVKFFGSYTKLLTPKWLYRSPPRNRGTMGKQREFSFDYRYEKEWAQWSALLFDDRKPGMAGIESESESGLLRPNQSPVDR